ncbi:hypothetical protein ACFQGW_14060 [Xanthomonas theicola]|uniref:hypothetical protein n=1 Tax=Xanthomonas theicola TaxID=56464 RepID=UPI00360E1CBB
MNDSSALFANPLLEVSDFDSASGRPMKLCVVPSAREPVRFAIPSIYMELVGEFDGARSLNEAVDAFCERHPGIYARDWSCRLVQQSLLPKGILVHAQQDPGRVAVSAQPRRAFLFIKLPIIKPGVVDPVAERPGFMFARPALLLGLLLFIGSHVYVVAADGNSPQLLKAHALRPARAPMPERGRRQAGSWLGRCDWRDGSRDGHSL